MRGPSMHDTSTLPRGERVALRQLPVAASVRLRELRGDDELSVQGVDTRCTVDLLDRLLASTGWSAAALCASSRDALLAALHRSVWGDRIVSSLRCAACEAMYDLSFTLSALQRELAAAAPPHRVTAPNCLEAEGRSYQLPTVAEEEEAAALGLAAGRAQLARLATGSDSDAQAVALLESLAPLLDVDLDTVCAECAHPQRVRFDVQSFVMQRILDEREHLLAEVHALAGGYGWSLAEILSLARSTRQALAQRLGGAQAALA
jgi:hypothetical protein